MEHFTYLNVELDHIPIRPTCQPVYVQTPLSRWKSYRQELLVYLEHFLQALLNGDPLCAPASRTEATWERFISCFREQGLISPDVPDAKSCRYVINATASRPLCFILDDNFYYQSMRYEVYQLARKYSLGFCQLFLDCPLECCLQRNRARNQPLPDEIICLMAKKIEAPNLDKNTWEQNSLTLKGLEYTSEDNLQVISLLVTALKNPVKQIEENIEQKAADRAICAASILHQADQTFRRMISQTMKDAKGSKAGNNRLKLEIPTDVNDKKGPDKNVLSSEMKILAEELNKLKAEFLEDLRQGNNQKYQVWLTNSEFPSKVTTSFQQESDNIVKKYIF
ncbi:PREDICTED: L-seryl-tRNA(Sec) kinase [Crocodylus porosus]|uniref:L-seryl-tRNA(Sec) kinase n=1 Tax=Crocodylus porosus TaxID=8502 RepID=UPI00093D9B14|nr:PREDICTED: L-seryl-tRNA(Sec) kinase [Crocodylus porosus]